METEATEANPLKQMRFRVPFHRIEPRHVEPAIESLLAEAQSVLQTIGREGGRTYADTLEALDQATERLERAITVVGHLESVASTPALREVYNRVKPEVSAFFARIPLDEHLYRAIKRYAETDEARALTGEKRRFLRKTLDEFRRHGAELPLEGKARLEAINRELAELTNRYAQNVVDATADYELLVEDEQRLAGLPPTAVEEARASALRKGKTGFRLTLQATSVIPALTYLEDRTLREGLYRAYNTRASAGDCANPPLITRILALRSEMAKLLGFGDFADLVLEDRMAQNGRKARQFILDLAARARRQFERENAELMAFRREVEGPDAPAIEPWDVMYYAEKQRRARYDFDEEALRPYFPVDRVLSGLFEMATRLFGLSVRPAPHMPTWHPEVRAFEVLDEDETVLGAFYADLFPRDEKRQGAWMDAFIAGGPQEGHFRPHLGLIAANLTAPLGDRPALLTHDEVSTLFHEFGHLLHQLVSRVQVRSLAGTQVAWDFVELPSQIMENWCWEREALDLFARHHLTGETIPPDLFEKMVRARVYREASAMMRQLGFAHVDLALHTEYDPGRDGDVVEYARAILQAYSPSRFPAGYAFIASFGHLFASAVGYAAGYYSYKWAEVLDADAFTRFRREGVFSKGVGLQFRRAILERGNSEDPMTLFVAFMGREPSLDALLERSGLASDAAAASPA